MSTDPNPTEPSPSEPSPTEPPARAISPSEPSPSEPSPALTAHGRRFKRRELQLADGGKLVLDADGSIVQLDGDGTRTHAWEPADPEWARHAIRFGLYPQDATVPPTGRYVEGMRPPRR